MRELSIALPVRCGPTGALLDANGFEIARFNWSDDIAYVVECINQRHRDGDLRKALAEAERAVLDMAEARAALASERSRAEKAEAERDALRRANDAYLYLGRGGKMTTARALEDERDALAAEVERLREALAVERILGMSDAEVRASVSAEDIARLREKVLARIDRAATTRKETDNA